MKLDHSPTPGRRRTWLALLFGVVAIAALALISVLAEPFLIALAMGPVHAEPRSSASGWANSSVWLGSIVACCLALLTIGYLTKRLSPARSWVAPITLLALVVTYTLFAQFPATRSSLRIALWSVALPASLVTGAWLASRAQNAA
jgi:hypothetical protein